MQSISLGQLQFQKKSKRKAGDGNSSGTFRFFTSSQQQSKWLEEADFMGPALIFGTGGSASIHYCNESFSSSTDCFVLKSDRDDIDMKYLYYFLRTNISILENGFKGAGLKHISKEYLSEINIPLPTLEEQKSIVAKLDKLTDLIELKKEAIGKTEELTKSVFLEMFGDPMINSKGWNQKELKYFGDIKTGNTPPRDNLENYGQFIEWIKSDNINNSSMIATKSTEFLSEGGSKVARIVPAGSILVTCIAGSPSCIGNCSIVNRSVTFNQQINAITPNTLINVYFLYFLFIIAKKVIQDASTNGMKGMVSKGVFEKIKFITPPISLQDSFAQVVQKNQFIIENQNQSLQKLQELYNTTTQELFLF